MDVQVRRLSLEESIDVLARLPAYAFVASPPLADQEKREANLRKWEDLASYALFEDGNAVSCASSASLQQRIRGKNFPMAGILHVATHPAARRKGYSRRVLQILLEEERKRGKWVSCQYPFRESFYQRLGYVTFPRPRILEITPLDLLPILDMDLPGTVRMKPIADGYDAYAGLSFRWRIWMMAWAHCDTSPFSARSGSLGRRKRQVSRAILRSKGFVNMQWHRGLWITRSVPLIPHGRGCSSNSDPLSMTENERGASTFLSAAS